MSSPAATQTTSRYGWRVGSLAGTPVFIARSWPIIAVVIVAIFGPALGRADRGPGYGYLVAGGYAALLLVSVLVHEAAHALVAQRRGHAVDRIVADVWGGHTVYDATRSSPSTTAVVAVAGPLSNLALGALAWAVESVVTNETASLLLLITARANFLVGIFNLLPGLPLDGGQIVSALVWRVTGRRGPGLTAAGWLGRAVAVGTVLWFVVRPLLAGRPFDTVSVIWPVAIAFFLWQGATQAVRAGLIHDATAVPVGEVLDAALLVPGTTTMAELGRLAASAPRGATGGVTERVTEGVTGASTARPWVVATAADGWPYGLIDEAALEGAAADLPPTTPVNGVVLAQDPSWVVPLGPDALLTDLVRAMSERSLSVALVVDEATRRVTGLATAERINEVVGAALGRRRP